MKVQSEQEIQKDIIDYLRLKGYVVIKHHSTASTVREGKVVFFANGQKGVADILSCSPTGTFTAIEVKKPGGKPTAEQIEFIENIKERGGVAFIAYSFEEVFNTIESITKGVFRRATN